MTTTPTTPAPMTAERLAELRSEMLPLAESRTTLHWQSIIDLFAHIDALTTRIAKLGRDRAGQQAETVREIAKNVPLRQEISRLEAELAAARKPPEDIEIARWVANLEAASNNSAFDEVERIRFRALSDLLTRQAAALKEAERKCESMDLSYGPVLARALAAEAKLETARRDALEEAAQLVNSRRSGGEQDLRSIAHAIRALRAAITAPPTRNEPDPSQ